jgi:TPR repeat protein
MAVLLATVLSGCSSPARVQVPAAQVPTVEVSRADSSSRRADSSSGGADSAYNLGVAAMKSNNFEEAAAQWSKAVASGNTYAMNNLGFLLYNGYGVQKDVARAIDLWHAAAVAGHAESQWHLGYAYESGVGVEQSLPQAYAWYSCSVENASNQISAYPHNERYVQLQTSIRNRATQLLTALAPRLNASELNSGKALAGEYIAKFGKPATEL